MQTTTLVVVMIAIFAWKKDYKNSSLSPHEIEMAFCYNELSKDSHSRFAKGCIVCIRLEIGLCMEFTVCAIL